MVKYNIRKASQTDCKKIISIVRNVYSHYELESITNKELPDLLDIESYYTNDSKKLFVIEAQGKCVGCSALSIANGKSELKRVYIEPEYWGNGIGISIVKYTLLTAQDHGVTNIHHWIDTRFERDHRFFEKLGFVYTGRVRPLFDINTSFEYHYIKTLNGK